MEPPPAATAIVTVAPEIARPFSSLTTNVGAVARRWPTIPVWPPPDTMAIDAGLMGAVVLSWHAASAESAPNATLAVTERKRIDCRRELIDVDEGAIGRRYENQRRN